VSKVDGTVFFGGETQSGNMTITAGAYQTAFAGSMVDGWVAAFDTTGLSNAFPYDSPAFRSAQILLLYWRIRD
jgi:hypothetical protein